MADTSPQPPITTVAALRVAHAAGFRGPALVMVVAIAVAESGLRPNARNGNTDGSIDRGILQINDHWHPEVADACADDPACAFKAGFAISQNGTRFDPWSTYQEGAPLGHLEAVWSVALTLGLVGMPHLDRPFALPAGVTDYGQLVTQGFRNNNPKLEPAGWLSRDGWIGYSQQPGAFAGNWHNGVDYGIAYGTPLHAPADGVIQLAGISPTGFGLRLALTHQWPRIATLYGHLSAIVGQAGDRVRRGQLVAHSGGVPQYAGDQRPGNSLGAHLHWSVLDTTLARYLDPWPYVVAPPASPPPTPTSPVHMGPFTATAVSDGYPVRIFDGPATTLPKVGLLTPGASVACDAWMLGESRWDHAAKRSEPRWFHRAAGGWVAGARVTGDPPTAP